MSAYSFIEIGYKIFAVDSIEFIEFITAAPDPLTAALGVPQGYARAVTKGTVSLTAAGRDWTLKTTQAEYAQVRMVLLGGQR